MLHAIKIDRRHGFFLESGTTLQREGSTAWAYYLEVSDPLSAPDGLNHD